MAGTHSPIDPVRYREVMGHYPTGVTVVTGTAEDGSPVGMVVGTFTSVSLSPPLVAFLPTASSQTFARLRTAAAYCINVLAHDQVDLCRAMAGSGPDKFAGVGWRPSGLGAPMLSDAVAHIHCLPQRIIEAGDHYIALCEVRAMDVNRQVTPLLFFQGGYGGFSPHGMTAGGDAELITSIRLADLARPQIEQLARELGCEAAVLVAVNDTELTTAATAHGGGAQMRHLLGERLPMKPPLGEAYVAWAPQDVIERWLAKAGKDPELVASYRRRLESLRGQGYAASLIGPDGAHDHDRLAELMGQYAAGDLTPAAERALLTRMAELMHFFDTAEFSDEQAYDIGGLMVPVRDSRGEIAMLLRLAQLPGHTPGCQVRHWIDRLRASAAVVESELRDGAGGHPAASGGARRLPA
jgi:flavin reductase (DIM6/NTAB) family NADH-FMN oxidoreductase RutF/DNA-binding IclR family transcriptional regulator